MRSELTPPPSTLNVVHAFDAFVPRFSAGEVLVEPTRAVSSHAQGITVLADDRRSTVDPGPMYVSYSDLPPENTGGLFIDSGAGPTRKRWEIESEASHPGGIAIAGRVLVVVCEEKNKFGWVEFYDLTDETQPVFDVRCGLEPPVVFEKDDKRTANGEKASAVGAAFRGGVLWVVVVSENRYVRVIRYPTGHYPSHIASFDGHDVAEWKAADPRIEGIALVPGRGDTLWLASLSMVGRRDEKATGLGDNRLDLFELRVHEAGLDAEGLRPADRLSNYRSGATILDHFRAAPVDLGVDGPSAPSFRWAANVVLWQNELCLLVTERGGSRVMDHGLRALVRAKRLFRRDRRRRHDLGPARMAPRLRLPKARAGVLRIVRSEALPWPTEPR